MRIEPLGDSALIVRVADEFERDPQKALDAVLAASRYLEAAAFPEVIELAPAYTTIGLFFDPAQTLFDALKTKIESVLQNREPARPRAGSGGVIEVPVCYEREFALDLDEVARNAGVSEAEVAARHSGGSYRVACVGFSPGFPYLTGLPAELATPRRATPRTEIPAGSVAIGGAQTGIYPRKSPGGWNVIGRTPLRLFDVRREPPALLQAGDQVRFRRISREEFDRIHP